MRPCPVDEPCSPRRAGAQSGPVPARSAPECNPAAPSVRWSAEPTILPPERARTARASPRRAGACHAPCKRGMPVDEGDNDKAPWKVGGVCCCRLATRASGPGKKSGRPRDVLGVEGGNRSAYWGGSTAWYRRAVGWLSLQVDAGASRLPHPWGCSSSNLSQAVPRISAGSRGPPPSKRPPPALHAPTFLPPSTLDSLILDRLWP